MQTTVESSLAFIVLTYDQPSLDVQNEVSVHNPKRTQLNLLRLLSIS